MENRTPLRAPARAESVSPEATQGVLLPRPTEPTLSIPRSISPKATSSPAALSDTRVTAGEQATSALAPHLPQTGQFPAAPPTAQPGEESPPPPVPETFRFLGVLGKLYVLIENASGLVLVDQHAAHERILFEQMLRRMQTQGVPSQKLLIPLTLHVGPQDATWLSRNSELLEKAGIDVEPFGAGVFKVDALPTFLKAADPTQLLHDIIDELRDTNTQNARLRLGEDMIAKTVCRHAVKANDTLREPELHKLVEDLLACELPYCCPHGRPTMIQISYAELEKKFGRKV
jgi:DNA mismatch repair protein MutL